MEISWYGLSCFRMKERGLATVVTDPYEPNLGLSALNLKADVVTVSHDAAGHNYLKGVKGDRLRIAGPGEFEVGGVFITGIAMATKATEEGKGKGGNGRAPNTLYVFNFDGLSVAHLGDLAYVPTQAQIEDLGPVDVALVPVGGGAALTAGQAAEVISLIEPSVVVPMHFKTGNEKVKLATVAQFLSEMGIGKREPLESLKLTKSALSDQTQVFVLEPTAWKTVLGSDNSTMAVKVIMTWDILPGREQEYFEFVVRDFVPGMQRIGIQPTEAWFTQYGQQPQILTGGLTDNLSDMQKALDSEDWGQLQDKLSEFVTNFNLKVVKASGGFQM